MTGQGAARPCPPPRTPVSPPKAELLSLTAALCIWLGEVKVAGCELSWPALSGHKAVEAVHALTSQGWGGRQCGGTDEPI